MKDYLSSPEHEDRESKALQRELAKVDRQLNNEDGAWLLGVVFVGTWGLLLTCLLFMGVSL